MPIEFTMRVRNADALVINLRKVPIADWSRAWPGVVARLERIAGEQFATRGERGPHGAWARLADSTLERKLASYGEQQILVASGALRDSLVEGTGDTIDERWPNRLRWGSSLPYALYHQTGYRTRLGAGAVAAVSDRRGGGMAEVPARRPIDFIPGEDDVAIGRVLTSWAAIYFRRLGFAIAKRGGFQTEPGTARLLGRAAAEHMLNWLTPTTGDTLFGPGT
jgi:hypothetical protein